ncbi:MAG TPA: SDR family oxidoreductase [Caldilineaceae bacterium]|nr:SDR family oxidoreductase [Caldilineaceae bacterium]
MIQLRPIEEQVVVLMGASSGIGRQAAYQFARRGAKVVASARDEEGLFSLVEDIRRMGGDATYWMADVADFDQVQQVAAHAVGTYGRIDTWVNLAAVSLYATFEETTPAEFRQVIDVNLMGQVHGAKAALPHLRAAGGGALICISSVEGLRTLPYQSAYGASKHGVIGFLEALRLELRHEGTPISVTNIMPTSINTPFFNKARTKLGVMPKGAPPLYSPRIVADAILYAAEHPVADLLVGDAARMMALMQRLSPRLVDWYLLATGFNSQRTQRPKPIGALDNLFGPLPGYDRVEGDFSRQTLPISLMDDLQRNRTAQIVAWGLLLGAMAGIAIQRRRNGVRRFDWERQMQRENARWDDDGNPNVYGSREADIYHYGDVAHNDFAYGYSQGY